MILVSMFDKKARAFFKPFTSATEETAVRELAQVAKSPESPIYQFPDDFDAVKIGSFNAETGELIPCAHVILSIPREVR